MGGPGAGHKSERARRARLVNMAKARAARKREPLRWRSGLESRVIEQLVWQWWMASRGAGRGMRGEGEIRDEARGVWGAVPVRRGNWVARHARGAHLKTFGKSANREIGVPRRPAFAKALFAPGAQDKPAGKPWAKLRVAQLLGVSHTWVNKLVKRFEADPERMRRRMAPFAPANLEKLERAREETRRQREMGWLRGPIRMRRVKWTLGGKTQRVIVWTQAERRRREGKSDGGSVVHYGELPAWARGGK